jgi:type II secretory pathway component PulC
MTALTVFCVLAGLTLEQAESGIRKDSQTYSIDRALCERALSDLNLSEVVRLSPAPGGRPGRFEIYPRVEALVFTLLGLRPGDILEEVNGAPPGGPGAIVAALREGARKGRITLLVERRGEPLRLTYNLGQVSRLEGIGERLVPATSPPLNAVDLDAAIHRLDDTHYRLDRKLLKRLLADGTMLFQSARIVPNVKDGRPEGMRLFAVRPRGLLARLGLQNGDLVRTVAGYDVSTPDKALEAYAHVDTSKSFTIELTRRERSVTLSYELH